MNKLSLSRDSRLWTSTQIDFEERQVATAFKAGCAVRVYGEPDSIDKLVAMHEVFVLISRHGINNPSVRDSVKQLLALDNYTPDEDKIDKIISKVRPLITLNTER